MDLKELVLLSINVMYVVAVFYLGYRFFKRFGGMTLKEQTQMNGKDFRAFCLFFLEMCAIVLGCFHLYQLAEAHL